VTLISVFSLKGSPGVTTLSCLLASAWSVPGPVIVVEADPSGGDLAARFELSSRTGWASLCSSARRSEAAPSLAPHLQILPGGLPTLVGSRGTDRRSARSEEGAVIRSGCGGTERSGLTVVDLGRVLDGDEISDTWLQESDASVLVVPGEASAAVQLRDRAPRLLETCNGHLGMVVVGGGYTSRELAVFAGIPVIGDVPIDAPAAAVASGSSGAERRLERSLLWMAAVRTSATLAARLDSGWPDGLGAAESRSPDGPVPEVTGVRRWMAGLRRSSEGMRTRVAPSGDGAAPAANETADDRQGVDA